MHLSSAYLCCLRAKAKPIGYDTRDHASVGHGRTHGSFNVSYRHIRSGIGYRTVQFRDGDYARLVDVASQRKLTK
jgi:hypothetical protein